MTSKIHEFQSNNFADGETMISKTSPSNNYMALQSHRDPMQEGHQTLSSNMQSPQATLNQYSKVGTNLNNSMMEMS